MTLPIQHLVIIAAISVCILFASGCSRSSSQPQAGAPTGLKDLGVVEFAPETPRQFDLGGGKICTLTASRLANGIEVNAVVIATNADGTIQHWLSRMDTQPGQPGAISLGDLKVGLTPTLKP